MSAMQLRDRYDAYAPMASLLDEARRSGKWLLCRYQQLWFSPAELAAAHAQGQFRWGPVNWELADPLERAQQLRDAVRAAQANFDSFMRRVNQL